MSIENLIVIGCLVSLLWMFHKHMKHSGRCLWIQHENEFINISQSRCIEYRENELSIYIYHYDYKRIIRYVDKKDYMKAMEVVERIIDG